MADTNRRWAEGMLLLGVICGFFSLFLATVTGGFNSMTGSLAKKACFFQQECPSGKSYHAETVSEMVSKANNPAAKLFFSFTLVGSLSLLLSKYPWELSNVYCGGTRRLRWLTAARAVAPPIGMLMVCTIPIVPRVNRTNLAIQIACNVHNVGACLYVGGYNVVEIFTLKVLWKLLNPKERILRTVCIVCGLLCTLGFLLSGALFSAADDLGICCTDKYNRTEEAFRSVYHLDNSTQTGSIEQILALQSFGPFVLVNSASQTALILKKVEFWLEVLAGVFVLSSHLMIWYFAKPVNA